MLRSTAVRQEEQAQRLKLKTQDQQLCQTAVTGAGLSPWEAQTLVDVVHQVYFREPDGQAPLRTGQLLYACAAATAKPGQKVAQLALVTVRLTVLHADDREIGRQHGAEALRRHRLLRLTEEAQEQGGLLTQEDLGQLLCCDERTVRRDVKAWLQLGVGVPTRGRQQDLGPTVTHKEWAVQRWLAGLEPQAVARAIKHTLHSVERYVHTFSRVCYLRTREFQPVQIAMTVGISGALTRTYLDLYERVKDTEGFRLRQAELTLIGTQYYQALDEKKGALLPPAKSLPSWRTA